MITGVVLRNFKTYKNINYIPLSNGSNYCGLIGLNGVGKSSVLEALDCFFNNKEWNRNIDSQNKDESYVMPIFVVDKSSLSGNSLESFVSHYSDVIKSFISNEIPSTINQQRRAIWESIKKQHTNIDLSNKYIFATALYEDNVTSIALFGDLLESIMPIQFENDENDETIKKKKEEHDNSVMENLRKLTSYLIDTYTYIYIPKDIQPERFVKFETEEIQHLIGSNLVDKVQQRLSENDIKEISDKLKIFIEELSDTLPNYKFKANSGRQPNLKSKEIYNLIVHDFFSKRELFKISDGKDIPLAQLSSGEKQQAITTLIHSCVTKYREENEKLIIAIDEPESALHISLCYEQFEMLYEISKNCNQVFFSSHWYGFIPAIPSGCVINIVKSDDKHITTILDIFNYREIIKQGIKETKGAFPIDISLKGINDLIQSIISSVINDNYYNWLICEGSSDKIYLDSYLCDEVKTKKLRIVPVCCASEVKKIYKQLELAFDDLKNLVNGKVFLLVDTDKDFDSSFVTKEVANLRCKRIVNDDTEKKTLLVNIQSNPKSPKTDIEDVLNGKIFKKVLSHFKNENFELSFVEVEKDVPEIPSWYAMDLRTSEYEKMDEFFSKNNGSNKVAFAKEYIKEMQSNNYIIPSWIEEIKNFFDGD